MNRAIRGLEGLTINNIFCIGRNYAQHAKELNNPVPESPMVFLKPNSAVPEEGEKILIPPQSKDVHHEVELVIAIGKTGKHISETDAFKHIAGYGIGIDFTARDIQQKAKEKGHPWSVAKGFDTFAPISEFLPYDNSRHFPNFDLRLQVNGEIRQQGNSADMIFPVPVLISYLSGIFTLAPGDLIFTGTPAGVGPVHPGDTLVATLGDGLQILKAHVQ